MKSTTILAYSPYGAFELKRCYQKNMLCGLLISSCAALMAILIFAILYRPAALTAGESEEVGQIGYTKLPPPMPMRENAGQDTKIKVKPDLSLFAAGLVPRPVEDNTPISTSAIPTRLEKVELAMSQHGNGAGGNLGNAIYKPGEMQGILVPEPDIFIARDVEPKLVQNCLPEYPEMARKAGLEGKVRMQIYVGTDGLVKRARVIKAEPEGMGFEEAALAAAWKLRYYPAMQNNNPVGVWVAYKVNFKIK